MFCTVVLSSGQSEQCGLARISRRQPQHDQSDGLIEKHSPEQWALPRVLGHDLDHVASTCSSPATRISPSSGRDLSCADRRTAGGRSVRRSLAYVSSRPPGPASMSRHASSRGQRGTHNSRPGGRAAKRRRSLQSPRVALLEYHRHQVFSKLGVNRAYSLPAESGSARHRSP
jgi:hypothetical protein